MGDIRTNKRKIQTRMAEETGERNSKSQWLQIDSRGFNFIMNPRIHKRGGRGNNGTGRRKIQREWEITMQKVRHMEEGKPEHKREIVVKWGERQKIESENKNRQSTGRQQDQQQNNRNTDNSNKQVGS